MMRKFLLFAFLFATPAFAQSAKHTVTLTWLYDVPQPNPNTFNVYRSETKGGPYSMLYTKITALTQLDNTNIVNGKTFYYVVTAVAVDGRESVYSNEAQAAIPPDGFPVLLKAPSLNPVQLTGGGK